MTTMVRLDLLHELLDRTHIASQHVQMALGDHPAMKFDKRWEPLYVTAVDKLEALYQAIGASLGDDEDK